MCYFLVSITKIDHLQPAYSAFLQKDAAMLSLCLMLGLCFFNPVRGYFFIDF